MSVPTVAPLPAAAVIRAAAIFAGLVAADYDDVFAKDGKCFGRREADAVGATGDQDLLAVHRTLNSYNLHGP